MVMPDPRKRKPDYYYFKAKEEGFKSRASYKLLQMHEKFRLFKRGQIIVDLCGAPGGWAQVAQSKIGSRGRVLLLDIQDVMDLEGVECYQKDITENDTAEFISELLNEGEHVDIVLSDCAPKVIGAWHTDQARQMFLAENALILGIKLEANIVVCKVFEGVGFNEFRNAGKKSYTSTRVYKPKASRKQSAETYILFKNYKSNDGLEDLVESGD